MELKLKYSPINHFPFGGFTIKGKDVKQWVLEIQLTGIEWNELSLYPVPSQIPNEIWGCLVVTHRPINADKVGKHELCQRVSPNLYLSEKAEIVPMLNATDHEKLFGKGVFLMHPEVGVVELDESFNLMNHLVLPEEKFKYVFAAEKGAFIPDEVKSFQVNPVKEEDVLKRLEEKAFPKTEKMPNEPLSAKEKRKLAFYKKVFGKKTTVDGNVVNEGSSLLNAMGKFGNLFAGNGDKWAKKMEEDYKNLEERNQNEAEKLLRMLDDNPEEALKYAIPLDSTGGTRGASNGQFQMTQRWSNFSLFGGLGMGGRNSTGGGGSVNLDAHFDVLRAKYIKTATDLIAKKEFEKAAFIYLKLLKDHQKAAEVLKQGHLYQEAALLYLKFLSDKKSAAECYELGKMYKEAIELYDELGDYLKVGDLYLEIKRPKSALPYYEKAAESWRKRSEYIQAAKIYQHKMNNLIIAQEVLMEGWLNARDAYNCLSLYLNNIPEPKKVEQTLSEIKLKSLNSTNSHVFLNVVHKEFKKNNETNENLREIAYQTIAQFVQKDKAIVNKLKHFNQSDQELDSDTFRFLAQRFN